MTVQEEIRNEIKNIDERLDQTINDYNKGKITEEELNREKIRFTSAKNALEWTLSLMK